MKRLSSYVLMAGMTVSISHAQEYPFCQILDRVDTPAWEAHLDYTTEAQADRGNSDFGIADVKGGGGLYYGRDDYGALDVSGAYDGRFFTGDGGIGLPDHVYDFHLNVGYVLRNANGQAVQVGAHPGLYSELGDLSMDDVFMPIDARGIQTVNDQFSLFLGAAVFPGFEQKFDPRFGARYAPSGEWLIDLAYPETRVTYMPQPGMDLYAGIKTDRTSEWRLDDNNPNESLRYYETRAFLGINAPVAQELRVMCQAGGIFDRTVDFADGQPEIGVDDAWFISVGLGGSLE